MKRLTLALLVLALLAGCGQKDYTGFKKKADTTTPAAVTAPYYPKVLMAAGDFNGGSQAGATASVMAAQAPLWVLGLGDYQYEYGDPSAFGGGFRPQMENHGIPLTKIKPTAGPTHDVRSTDGSDYLTNWGRDPFKPYSFNVGPRWHIINLPSAAYRYGVNTATTQAWLDANLNANTRPCVIAYWHEPFFTNTSSSHSATESDFTKPWISSLYAHHAEIVLGGHQHDYQRFKPQTPDKVASAAGIVQFVVGTGGVGFYSLSTGEPNLATQNADTYGALKLTLFYNRWTADFLRSGGGSFTDHAGGKCH